MPATAPRLALPGALSPAGCWALCLAAMIGFAALSWPTATTDLPAYTLPWLEHIRRAGPLAAFAAPFGNYTPPYLYLLALVGPLADWLGPFAAIKLLSYAGHLLLALSGARLLRALGAPQPAHAALLLIAPTLLLNPAVLVQCDAFWAAPLTLAVAAAVERRQGAMLGWCGLAFAIKAQAAFTAPFFLAAALAHPPRWRDWAAAPLACIGAMLPAWLAGWPAADLATIYLRQTGWSQALSLNAPNLWAWVQAVPGAAALPLGPVATIAALLATLAYVGIYRRRLRGADAPAMLQAACLGALILPGLLPRMHERYFFMAEVLTLTLALAAPRWRRLALLVQLGAALGLLGYLSGWTALAMAGAVPMLIATAAVLPRGRAAARRA